MQRAKTILSWIDQYVLLVLAAFLLAFIPLYPKIPILDILPGYIVRVRLEDFFVVLTGVVFVIQLLRRKISLRTPLTKWIVAYAMIGAFSMLSAIFLIHTVPPELLHISKTGLHLARYIEYFFLFFVVFASVKTKRDVYVLSGVVLTTLIALVVYGIGQKYWYWPVYSTMNREFSKGIRLFLTEHARVQSTFAGHYDLGAYLAFVLPFLTAAVLVIKRRWLKILLWVVLAGGIWLLVVSASRISFGAFLMGAFISLTLLAWSKPNWRQRIWWLISRYGSVLLLTSVLMLGFGGDLSERFLQLVDQNQVIHDTFHEANRIRKDWTENYILIPLGIHKPGLPAGAISTDDAAMIIAKSDQRPSTTRPGDVYVDIPDKVTVATQSASGSMELVVVEKPRTYSDNALKVGLSLAIRLDTLWPQAIKGFMRNPLLGSGYATLNKEGEYQFTEADSTDNNFLRTLGETGLLGFISFYGAILFGLLLAWKTYKRQRQFDLVMALTVGFIGATIALLINAVYIDVFAASKVAFTFWAFSGAMLALFHLSEPTVTRASTTNTHGKKTKKTAKKQTKTS